jgi:hypothetical protein
MTLGAEVRLRSLDKRTRERIAIIPHKLLMHVVWELRVSHGLLGNVRTASTNLRKLGWPGVWDDGAAFWL